MLCVPSPRGHLVLSIVVAAALAACADAPPPAAASAGPSADAAGETSQVGSEIISTDTAGGELPGDAGADAVADPGPDSTADVAADVIPDAQGDLVADVEDAGGAETEADVPGDAAPDTGTDAADDAATDIAADAGQDGGAEVAIDASGDGAADGADGGPACPGAPDCPCSGDGDCPGGACALDKAAKKVCVTPCGGGGLCPSGFACATTAGKGWCLAADIGLCAPCSQNAHCAQVSAAGKPGACVSQGAAGSYCGYQCAAAADCPTGYACQDAKDANGAAGKFCVPENNGPCACSTVAIALAATTTCNDGLCTGTRACSVAGLSACSAPKPAAEVCDGEDNDCNGVADDGSLCDDKNPCTQDGCGGSKGCGFAPQPDGKACDDGDACTTEKCAAGKCLSTPLACDDGKPCTKVGCDKATGCTAANDDGLSCSDGNPCTKDLCKAGACVSDSGGCDDGNKCTADACDKAKGCTNTAQPASACDDGDACTTDSCDPGAGCVHALKAGCLGPLAYATTFPCDDKGWTLDPAPPFTTASWGIDATPAKPGFLSPACSLNFNNGVDFACSASEGGKIAPTFAKGPVLDLSGWAAGTPAKVTFWLGGKWEGNSYDNLRLESTTDGGATWQVAVDLNAPATATFAFVTTILPDVGAKKLQLRFAFDTTDCFANATEGPFIDDLSVVDATCKDDKGCDDQNPCTTDTCTVATGLCLSKNNTATCDDGDPCTFPDSCGGGSCSGPGTDGPKCDDDNPCTSGDTCMMGYCEGNPVQGPCDDGNLCTSSDACVDGSCGGVAKPCDDKQPCTSDSCDPKTGACTSAPLGDGNMCNDGDACTKQDHCEAAKCVSVPQCDDGNPCTTDACTSGTCSAVAEADGVVCSDNDPCTAGDVCAAGSCKGAPAPCSTAWQMAFDCTQAQAFDVAPIPASPTATAWAIDATASPPAYKSAACSLNFNNGSNFQCSSGQTKVAGTATTGQPIDLTKAKAATLRLWSYGGTATDGYTDQRWVEASADGFKTVLFARRLDNAVSQNNAWKFLAFDLGNATGKAIQLRFRFDSLHCLSNSGVGWFVDDAVIVTDLAKGCADASECGDGIGCTDDLCQNGKCVHPFSPTTAACSDGSMCTTNDKCDGKGACVGGAALACNDGNACTADSCDGAKGCLFKATNDGTACSDGDACTTDDTCKGGNCVAKPLCDDGNPCTDDSCTAGLCANKAKADASPCSDIDPCTAGDACQAGKCLGTLAPCSAAFKDDLACGSKGWAVPPPGAPTPVQWAIDATGSPGYLSPACSLNFNNGNNFLCPTGATSVFGDAATAKLIDLSAAKQAVARFKSYAATGTSDAADLRFVEASADGFKTVPVSVLLDNDVSNSQWKSVVVDLTPLAGKAISLRFRFESVNCDLNSGAGWFIDDVSVWTDIAIPCASVKDCDDGSPCTAENCAAGKCTTQIADGASCEDGNACTVADTCKAGACGGGPAKTCNDGEACTADACNPQTGCTYTPAADGGSCSDGNACTLGDACKTGKCTGTNANNGVSCSDGDNCTSAETCQNGVCKPVAGAPDGTSCSTDACLTGGVCKAGVCSGKNACDDGNPCTADACSLTGKGGSKICNSTAMNEGAACDDGDLCTAAETCQAGACKAAANACTVAASFPMDCATSGWTLDPASGGVSWAFDATPNPPGFKSAGCSLNLNNGVSFPGTIKMSATSPEFTVAPGSVIKLWTWFDTETGLGYDKKFVEVSADGFATVAVSVQLTQSTTSVWFQPPPIALDALAGKKVKLRFRFDSVDSFSNSGKGWFVDDVVVSTVAVAGCASDAECPSDNNPCTKEVCAATKCQSQPLNGNLCDDGEVCSTGSACQAGKCALTVPLACDDGDPCTDDACLPGKGCAHTYKPGCGEVKLPYAEQFDCGGPLTHWLLLNQPIGPKWAVDAKPTPPGALTPACSLNFNNDVDFQCPTGATGVSGTALSPIFDATDQPPGKKIVVRFQYAGQWESNTFDNFDVAVLPVGGTQTAVSSTFDGSNAWPIVGIDASKFAGSKFRVRFQFTATNCFINATSGPFVDNFKVGDPTCAADADCNDFNPCTTDKCSAGSCGYSAHSLPCNDGNACTLVDKCAGGACTGIAKVCDDGNDCTVDACALSGDCSATAKADATQCSDGNACTAGEKCTAGACSGGSPAPDSGSCSDGNACTTGDACAGGVCKPSGSASDGVTCSDGNPCTTADTCKAGKCASTAPSCDDKNPCTTDACIPNGTAPICSSTPVADGSACDDGDACTDGDACAGGGCKAKAIVCGGLFESFEGCTVPPGWVLDPVPANKVAWGVDGTPANPGAYQSACSLNFNDGAGYAGSGGASKGKATSPEIDLTTATMAALTFWSYSGVQETGTYDKRTVEILEGTTVLQSIALTAAADLGKWVLVSADLKAHIGKKIRLRFAFDSVDDFANAGPGWFVDAIKLQTSTGPKVWQVTTSGFTFSPTPLTIAKGDVVEFTVPAMHNVVEVDLVSWEAGEVVPVAGGFSVGFGQTKKVPFPKAGTYYYVCAPHAGFGMKGQIVVK